MGWLPNLGALVRRPWRSAQLLRARNLARRELRGPLNSRGLEKKQETKNSPQSRFSKKKKTVADIVFSIPRVTRRHSPFSPYVAPRFPHTSEMNSLVSLFVPKHPIFATCRDPVFVTCQKLILFLRRHLTKPLGAGCDANKARRKRVPKGAKIRPPPPTSPPLFA